MNCGHCHVYHQQHMIFFLQHLKQQQHPQHLLITTCPVRKLVPWDYIDSFNPRNFIFILYGFRITLTKSNDICTHWISINILGGLLEVGVTIVELLLVVLVRFLHFSSVKFHLKAKEYLREGSR